MCTPVLSSLLPAVVFTSSSLVWKTEKGPTIMSLDLTRYCSIQQKHPLLFTQSKLYGWGCAVMPSQHTDGHRDGPLPMRHIGIWQMQTESSQFYCQTQTCPNAEEMCHQLNVQLVWFCAFAGYEKLWCCSQFIPVQSLIAQSWNLCFVKLPSLQQSHALVKHMNNCHFIAVC